MAVIKHLDGCPKKRIEKRTRSFVRGGDRYEAKVEACLDCGARVTSKPRKVTS